MKMVNFSFSIITETSGESLKRGLGLWRDRRLCTHRKLAVKDAAPARPGPGSVRSGRPDRAQELADLGPEPVALERQRFRRGEHLRRGRSGLAGATLHVGDVGRDLRGTLGGMLDVAGYFLRRRALLFHLSLIHISEPTRLGMI